MKKYITLMIAALFVGIVTNIGHPITPYYINQIELPKIVFGYFFAMMSVGMLLFSPIWGAIGDVKGRKKIAIICIIGYGVGQALFGIFTSVFLILIARLISGIFIGGLYVSFLSYLTRSKELSKYNQTRLSASYISFQLVGVALGSFIGGALGELCQPNYRYVFFIQALILLVFAGYVLIFIDFRDEVKTAVRSTNPFSNFTNIKLLPKLLIVFFFVIVLVNIAFTDVSKYLDVYFSDTGGGVLKLGIVNLFVGVVTLIVNLLVTPIIIKKFKLLSSMMIFTTIGGIMLILTFSLPNLMLNIYTFYMVYIIAKAIIESVIVEYLSLNKDVSAGILMGIRQSLISLGNIIGVLIGGVIYAYHNVVLFYICACVLFISGIIVLIINHQEKKLINSCK